MFYYLKLLFLIFYNLFNIPLTYFLFKYKIITEKKYNKNIKDIIIYNGPIFIKYVQLLLMDKKTLKTHISIDLIEELTNLEDKVYTNIQFTDNVIINNTVYLQNYNSTASGSICAIYEFSNNNEVFIVKKIHKNIDETINLGYIVLKLVVYVLKKISLTYKIILSTIDMETFVYTILKQSSMTYEAENLKQFYNLYNHYKIIRIPRHIYNNDQIIVMKKLHGYKFNDFIDKFPDYTEELYHVLISSIYLMISKKLLHGDFHLGNILFSLEDNKVVINIYDFGIIFNLNDVQSESLLNYIETQKIDHLTSFLKTINKNITKDLLIKRKEVYKFGSSGSLDLSGINIPLEIINILSILFHIKNKSSKLDINKLFDFMVNNDILE